MKRNILTKILVPAILLPALFISCTKSGALTGGGSSGSSGTINGSVNGGLSPVSGATVNLMMAGTATPLASASTTSNGSFSLVTNFPVGNGLLYLSVTGGNSGNGTNSNNQFLSIAGTTTAPLTTLRVNELTTAAAEEVALNFSILNNSNGTVTLSAPVNSAAMANVSTQFSNLIAAGNLNTSNSNLSTAGQNGLNAMANAFASCVENSANCAALFNNSISLTNASARSLLEAGLNALQNTNTANPLYTLAYPLAGTTGFTLPSSSMPSGFTFNNPAPTVSQFTIGGGENHIAIDGSGNIWITNASGASITKLSSQGALLGTFNLTDHPVPVAIDAAGNVWIGNYGNCCFNSPFLQELNSAGTQIASFGVANNFFSGLRIDAAGNLWAVMNVSPGAVNEYNSSGSLLAAIQTGGGNAVKIVSDIAFDAAGNLYTHSRSPVVVGRFVPPSTTLLQLFSPPNTTSGSCCNGNDLAVDPSGNIWVTDFPSNQVFKLSPSGGTVLATLSISGAPNSLTIDANGNVWVTTTNGLVEVSPSGVLLGTFNPSSFGFANIYTSLAIDTSGNIWAAGSGIGLVRINGMTAGPQFFPYSGPQWP